MNKIFTFLAFVISLSAFSQKSNLIVFNNGGQQFFVVLNGIRQNAVPKTNVKIEGLAPVSYKVKIIFADGKTGDIDKNVYLEPNMEYSAQVIIKNPKKRSLRLFDLVPLNTSPYGTGSETVTYRPNDAAGYSDQQGSFQSQTNTNVNGQNGAVQMNGNVNGVPNGTATVTTSGNMGTTQNGSGTVQSSVNVNGVPTGTATVTTSGNMGTTTQNGNGTVQSSVNVNGVPTGTATVTTSGNMGTSTQNGNGTVQSSVNINGVPMGSATVTTSGNMGNPNGTVTTDVNGMPVGYSQTAVTNPDGSQTITTTVNGQTTTVTTNPSMSGQINMGMNGIPNGTQTSTTTVNGQTTTVTSNVSGTTSPNGQTNVYNTNGTQTTTTTVNGQTTSVTTNVSGNGTHVHADGTVHDHNHNPVNTGAGTHTHSDGTVHDHNHRPVVPMGAPGDAVVNANGTLTCRTSVKDVDVLLNAIKQENFSEDKMDLVKISLNKKCINSDQAVQIVKSFTFDGDKIEMAKFCYDHMTDRNNSIKLLELFSFSSSKDELKTYFSK